MHFSIYWLHSFILFCRYTKLKGDKWWAKPERDTRKSEGDLRNSLLDKVTVVENAQKCLIIFFFLFFLTLLFEFSRLKYKIVIFEMYNKMRHFQIFLYTVKVLFRYFSCLIHTGAKNQFLSKNSVMKKIIFIIFSAKIEIFHSVFFSTKLDFQDKNWDFVTVCKKKKIQFSRQN